MAIGQGFLCTLAAAFRVTGGTGASTVARGGVSARTGAGVYTLTLTDALDAVNYVPAVTATTSLIDHLVYTDTSDNVKTLDFRNNAGASTDSDFSALFWRIAV